MIIPCRQCHTRFKVPDGKVKARGLKVRCSRCAHTFRIYPDSGAEQGDDPAPAAARPRGPDPFEAFGPAGTSDMEKTPARGTTVSALVARMAPAPAEEDFDVDVSGVEPASTEPAWNFPPAPSRPGPAAAAAVALQEKPAEELPGPSAGAVAARSPVPVRALPAAADPEPFPEEPETSPDLLSAPGDGRAPIAVRPLPAAPPSGLANLFEDQPGEAPRPHHAEGTERAATPADLPSSEDLASLAGFTPAWGMSAPSRALSVDGILSSHTPSLAPAVEPVAPPPTPQFGGVGTVLDDLPSLEPGPLPAHGEIELDAGTAAPDWSGVAAFGPGGNQIELEPELPSMELDRRPAPEPVPAPALDPPWSLAAVPAASASPPAPGPAADLAWLPPGASAAPPPLPGPSAGLGWDDPFSEPPPPLRPPPPPVPEAVATLPRAVAPNAVMLDEAPAPSPRAPDHGLFEMPASSVPNAPGPSTALFPDIPETVEGPPAPVLPATSGPMPSIISKPPGRVRLGLQERELPGAARQVSAVVLNVGLAGLLLLVVVGLVSSWATAGRVDGSALSPRRLLQALRPGVGVTPVEVTPGTYETRTGRSLLYVRGRVQNRGAPPARVRVRAEVWDGAQAVKTGETLAGAIATPEELWRAVNSADVEALRARLAGAATPVADGQQADFLVLLDEAPRDLSGLRLKVTASVER